MVRADPAGLQKNGKPLSVLPGMTGSVEIRTGQRSVLNYMLRPMIKSQEAFRER
jgi:adhesin transport system membrane fusion protein